MLKPARLPHFHTFTCNLQLKMSMEERRGEVEVHRDGLRAELKALREDVHRITLELKERLIKVGLGHASQCTFSLGAFPIYGRRGCYIRWAPWRRFPAHPSTRAPPSKHMPRTPHTP